MTAYKFSLLRNFVSTLEMLNPNVQGAILEAMDIIEGGDEASGSAEPIADAEDMTGTEVHWATLHDSLKALAGDDKIGDMQVILKNNAGDTYLFFKRGKVDFVTTASGEKEAETDDPEKEGSKFLGKGY